MRIRLSSRLGTLAAAGLLGLACVAIPSLSVAQDGQAGAGGGSSSTVTVSPPASTDAAKDIVDLSGGQTQDYSFAASLDQGVIVLRGKVPIAADKARFAGMSNVDTTALEVAPGAPERFDAAIGFGMKALGYLSTGKFTLKGRVATLHGVAASAGDYEAVRTLTVSGVPAGVVLVRADIAAPGAANSPASTPEKTANQSDSNAAGDASKGGMGDSQPNSANTGETAPSADATGESSKSAVSAPEAPKPSDTPAADQAAATPAEPAASDGSASAAPPATESPAASAPAGPATKPAAAPYLWAAEKGGEGGIVLSGDVPSADVRDALSGLAGMVEKDTSIIASGAPSGFAKDAEAALEALDGLDGGRAAYSGTRWSLTGQAATADQRDAALSALSAAETPVDEWLVDIQVKSAQTVEKPTATPAGKTQSTEKQVESSAPQGKADQSAAGETPAAKAPATSEPKTATSEPKPKPGSDTKATETATPEASTSQGAEPGTKAGASSGAGAASTPTSETQKTPETGTTGAAPSAPKPETASEAARKALSEAASASSSGTAESATASEQPAKTAVNPDYAFSATRGPDGSVVLDGMVPADAARRYFGSAAGDKVDNRLTVAKGAPDNFITDALGGLDALSRLETGTLGLKGGNWSLTGKAPDEKVQKAIHQQVAALPDGGAWHTDISLPSPTTICRRQLAALSEKNAILFNPGSTHVAADSRAAIDEFATDLAGCPDAPVYVQGHTDSQGPAKYNMALSVARAEAVVKELAARGIDPKRLYAVGYGETLPVASNDTAAGRARNRRIVITIPDKVDQEGG